MRKYIHFFTLLLFLGLSASSLKAQWVADFTSAITANGCGVATYNFASIVTNGGVPQSPSALYYHWDFGNGTNTGSQQELGNTLNGGFPVSSPSRSYLMPGTYTVLLRVYSAQSPAFDPGLLLASVSEQVIVYTFPTPDFSANVTEVCLGDPITLTDITNYGAQPSVGSVLSRRWNMGNGNFFDITNPAQTTFSYTFPLPGDYQITLTTRTSGGRPGEECVGLRQRPAYIRVRHRPQAIFAINPVPPACSFPYAPSVTNTSTIAALPAPAGSITSYIWRFYNGIDNTFPQLPFSPITTLTNTPPSIPPNAYNASGTYAITLEAVSSTGCRDVATRIFTINAAQTANFNLPATTQICTGGTVQFTDASTAGAASYSWTLSGATPAASTLQNPTVTFVSSGTYNITLNTTYPDGCVRTVTKPYTVTVVAPPNANFTNSPTAGFCFTPKNVTFIPLDPINANYSYTWNFGENIGPGLTGPIVLGYSNSNIYEQFGDYNVALTVRDNITGCQTTVTRLLSLRDPVVSIIPRIPTIGCAPLNVNFDISMNAIEPITRYRIDYDGNGSYEVDVVPTHTPPTVFTALVNYVYPTRGNYIPAIEITTSNGCVKRVTSPVPIKVGTAPQILSVIQTGGAGGCQGSGIGFTPVFAPGFEADSIIYAFSDGGAGTTVVTAPFSTNHFFTQNGAQGTTITAFFNGCPIAVPFNYSIPGAGIQSPITSLQVVGGIPAVCTGTANNNTICVNVSGTLVSPTSPTIYTVAFGDGNTQTFNSTTATPAQLSNICNTYLNPGTYTITLTATGNNGAGCAAASSQTVTISPDASVNVDFVISPNPAISCSANQVSFASTSMVTAPGISISQYIWNFGDGSPIVTLPHPAGSNTTHTYSPSSTLYNPTLTLVLSNGCTKAYSGALKTVNIQGPNININATPSLAGCTGIAINFAGVANIVPNTNSIVTWEWDFGDPVSGINNLASGQNSSHVFNTAGSYTVTLRVRDNNTLSSGMPSATGCISTRTVNVQIFNRPTASFTINRTTVCVGSPISFTSATNVGATATYFWDFGDGNTSIAANPVHTYSAPAAAGTSATYNVALTVTNTAGGCSRTVSQNFTATNVAFDIRANGSNMGITVNCPPQAVSFTSSFLPATVDPTGWIFNWQFGDGNQANSQNATNEYNAPTAPRQFDVVFTATNTATGCSIVRTLTNFVTITGPRGTFSFTPTNLCKPGEVTFTATNFTGSPREIIWDFGDGSATQTQLITAGETSKTIPHTYTTSGSFLPNITLVDGSVPSCKVAYPSPGGVRVNVSGNPNANFTWTGGGQICRNVTVNFTDQSTPDPTTGPVMNPQVNRWSWTIFDGSLNTDPVLFTSLSQNPSFIFGTAKTYLVRLQVRSAFNQGGVPDGCPAVIEKFITIVDPTITASIISVTPLARCPGELVTFTGQANTDVSPKNLLGVWRVYENPMGITTPNTTGPLRANFNAAVTPAAGLLPWGMTGTYAFPASGTYTVELIVTDAALCTGGAVAAQVVTVDPLPTFTAGPSNQSICVGGTATFTSQPSAFSLGGAGVTYQWQQSDDGGMNWVNVIDGPFSGAIYAGAVAQNLTITNGSLVLDGYRYRVLINKVLTVSCQGISSVAGLTVNQVATPAVVNPSVVDLCDQIAPFAINGNVPAIGVGRWSKLSGPVGGNITNDLSNVTTVIGLQYGTYVYEWRITSGACPASAATITITNSRPANAGINQNFCNVGSFTLSGNDPALSGGGTGQWTLVSGPSAVTFAPNDATSNATVNGVIASATPYIFRWTITGAAGCGTTNATVQVLNSPQPVVTNPAPQTICAGQNATFSVTGGALNYQWQVDDGGGSGFVDISNGANYSGVATQTLTVISPTVLGFNGSIYRVRITNPTTTCTNQSNGAQLVVLPNNIEAVSVLGTNPICLGDNITIRLSATKVGYLYQIRDGVTPVSGVAIITGDGNPQNFTPFAPTATATYNVLIVSPAFNSVNCSQQLTSTVTVVVNPPPSTSFAGANFDVCGTTATLNATAPTTGAGFWTVLQGTGLIAAGQLTNRNATITNLSLGINRVQWRVTNGVCPPSDSEVIITGKPVGTPAAAGPDQIICVNPLPTNATLAGNDPGTTGSGTWTRTAGGATINNASQFNTTVSGLDVGVNTFRWTVLDLCTNVTTSDEITINVQNPVVPPSGVAPINLCGINNTNISATAAINGIGLWTVQFGSGIFGNSSNATTSVTGLSNGLNIFRWTVSNSCGSQFTEVTVTVNPSGSPAAAGPDQRLCITTTTTTNLNATLPVNGIGAWSRILGGAAITASASNTTAVTNLTAGLNRFRWSVTDACGTALTDDVDIFLDAAPTVASAGATQTVCGVSATLAANPVNAANGETGAWALISGTGVFTPSNPNTTVIGLSNGNNVFEWRITNTCGTTSSQVTINAVPPPPTANAGPDQTFCSSITILGATPLPMGSSGLWTIVSQPSGAAPIIVDNTNPNSVITNLQAGTTVLRWTVANSTGGTCPTTFDQVSITSNSNSVFAYAGPNVIQCASTVTLQANTPALGTNFYWTLPVGTTVVTGTLGTPGGANGTPTLTVSGLAIGSNVFTWTVGYVGFGCSSAVSNVDITRIDTAPVVNAGVNQAICQTLGSATLNGNTPSVGIGTWTVTTQPVGANVTFVNANQSNTVANGFTLAGNYTLRWTITNGTCASNFATMQVIVTAPPSASVVGANQTVCAPTATLAGNIPAVGTGNWTLVSQPSGGAASISTSTANNSGVTGLTAAGDYVFQWTISNGACTNTTSNVTITRNATPTSSVAGANQNICSAISTLTGNIPAFGVGTWTSSAVGVTFGNANLGTSSVSNLPLGTTTLTWTITNAPCAPSVSTMTITRFSTPTGVTAIAGLTPTCLTTGTITGSTPVVANGETGAWTVISGTATIVSPTSAVSVVNNLSDGTNVFRWTVSNVSCAPVTADVTIIKSVAPTASVAGANQNICSAISTLTGNIPAFGVGTWTSSAVGVTFGNANLGTSSVSNLPVGTTTLTWTITNAPCAPSASTMTITRFSTPTGVTASAGLTPTCLTTGTITGSTPVVANGETGAWTVISGTATIVSPTSAVSAVNNLSDGTNVFRWTVSNVSCAPVTADVTIIKNPTPTASNAGSPQTICATSYVLNGNAPAFGTGTWSFVSGPVALTNANFGSINQNNSTISGMTVSGVYRFTWTITNAPCASSASSVDITVNAPPTAATVGATQNICGATTALTGNNPTVGTGQWTVIAGGATVDSPTQFNSTVSGMTAGINRFRWTTSNGICASTSSDLLVNSFATPVPANAGTDVLSCGVVASLNASTPTAGIGTWSYVGVAPGGLSFANINNPSTTVSGLPIGTHTLRWTVANLPCTGSSDDVVVTVRGAISLSVAGISETICGPTYNLNANVPVAAAGEIGTWSVIGGATIAPADINNPTAVATNLAVGFNLFTWTVSNGCATSVASIVITRNDNVTPSNAGTDQTVCATTAQLSANSPTVGTGAWTVISGTGVFVSAAQFNTNVSGLGVGVNEFRWTISNGLLCTPSFDNVIITRENPPSTAIAGTNQTICADNTILAATASAVGTGAWTVVSGTGAIANPTLFNAQVTNLSIGANVLRWTTSNGTCPTSSNTVTITRDAPPTPSFAGSDQLTCNATYTLAANPLTIGTGVWTVTAGTGVVTNPNFPNSTITSLNLGINTFTWTVTNGTCPVSISSVNITRTAPATVATVGTNQTTCLTTANLTGNTAAVGIGTWVVTSGSATVTDPTNPTSGVTGLSVGINTFRWRISNACSSTDAFLTITRETAPTTASAGTNQTTCNTFFNALSGNAPTSGTGLWTVTFGSATVTDVNNPTSGVTGLSVGINTFRWTITNSCGNSFAEVSITRETPATVATVGTNQIVCSNIFPALTGNTAAVGIGTWTVTVGSATVTDPTNPTSGVTGLTVGINTFRWTITNSCGTTSANVSITQQDVPTVAIAGTNQSICASSATLNANTPAVGIGTWTLTSVPVGFVGVVTFNNANQPNAIVSGLTLAGSYTFNWTITNGTCPPSTASVNIAVIPTPFIANAGINQDLCSVTTTNLTGNTAAGATGAWTQTSGAVAILVNANTPNLTVNGLTTGSYTFRWTLTGGTCAPSTSDVIVRIAEPANAGTTQNLCALTTTTLAGNTAIVGVGTWTQVAGAVATIASINSPNSGITGLTTGTYTFRWTITGSPCGTTNSDVVVNVVGNASAGVNQVICNITNTTLAATAPVIGIGTWTVNPNAGVTITAPTSPTSTVTGLTVGTAYTFTWTISGTPCAALVPQSMTVTVAPSANAGLNQALCNVTTATLAGNTPLGGAIGIWTQILGTTATISNPNSPNSAITGLTSGTFTFRWTFTGGGCATTFSDVVITNSALANAGINQNLCGVGNTTLAGNTPATGTGTWTKISGPAGEMFANANSPTTTVTGLINGTYIFQWEITGGSCPTTNSQMTILVSSPADAGVDISVCGGTSVNLNALPPTTGMGTWSQISGPGTANFSGNVFNATANNLQTGVYTFRWTITGSACTPSTDDVVVRVSENANAGADQAVCNVTTVTLAGNAAITGTGTWTQISGNPATITSPNLATSTVTGLTTGAYIFQWTFAGGICGNSNDQVAINVSAPTSAGANQNICGATFTSLSATAPIAGTGLWTQILGPGIASISNTGITNPTVSGLQAGTYVFRWTITGVPCPNLFSEVTIVNAEVPNAGSGQTICLGSNLTLNAKPVVVGVGAWSQVSGPSSATFANNAAANTSVTALTVGTYIFRWTVAGTVCATNTSDVTMTVIGVNATNASAAVSDTEYCDNQIPPSATVSVSSTQNGVRYELRRADNSLVATQIGTGSSLAFTVSPAPTSMTTYTVVAIPTVGGVSCTPVELADKGVVTVKVCERQSIGLAKTVLPLAIQANGSVNVTYLLTVRNLGNTELTNIQVNDDLTTVFPAPARYSIVTPPTATGVLLANVSYTGTAANPNLLTGFGRLAAGETQTVSFTVNLIPNALSGNYTNTAIARGERGSIVVTDRSTDGVSVDPDNDGDPRENTPTVFTLPPNLSRPRIGIAKNLFSTSRQANGSFNVTYQMTVSNYGNIDLTNVQIVDDLNATFPSPAQFSIVGTPSATGSLTANPAYTGTGGNNVLVNGGRLAAGESQNVVLTVNLIPNTSSNVTYRNTATASGENGTNRVTDNSSDGTNPDPNGDGDPREESPTPFVVPASENNNRPLLGVAKTITTAARQTDGSYNVTYSITVRNYGSVEINNLQVSDDLAATFPAPAVFRVTGAPAATGSLVANATFTGIGSSSNLLTGGRLAVGESQTITFSVNLTPNAASAFYRNTAVGSGENGTNRVTDASTDGLNPDPNSDRSPDENIPTVLSIPANSPRIGVAKNILSSVRQANGSFNLTYLITVRNYGNLALSNVQVTDNLANTFPSPAQFSVVTAPTATGGLVGNSSFTGTGSSINLLSSGNLGIGERQSITFTVNLIPNATSGTFRNTAIGRGENGGIPTTDTSSDGLNPDPDNDGNPREESPTIFNLPADNNNNRPFLGVAKSLATPVRQADGSYNFTYQIVVRNYGTTEITNLQVTDDLAATFPAPAQFRVINAPISAGNLTTNVNYTGRAGNNNLLNGNGRLGVGESQTITFTVNVIPNTTNGASYRNTAIGNGLAGGVPVTDISTEGFNPDPNGDGSPSEDTPTIFILQPETNVQPIATRFAFTTDNCASTILREKVILQNSGLVKITLLPNTVTALRGVVSISTDGTMIYRPALNAVGLDSLEYEICNSINVCAKGKIFINVLACTSQPPVIRPDEFGTDNCTEVKGNVLPNDTDPNGTALKVKAVTNKLTVSGGVYSIATDGTFSYLPPKSFVGRDSMTYEACNSVPTLSKCGSAKIYVDVLDCQETFIPEGFSPNGDGVNDALVIKGAERFDIKLQIFNRWGNLIYEDEHYKNTWDAIATVGILVGSGVPDGTYYYIVDFRNGQKPKVGFLTIQR